MKAPKAPRRVWVIVESLGWVQVPPPRQEEGSEMKLYVVERKSERGKWGVRVRPDKWGDEVQYVFLTKLDAEGMCCMGDRVVEYVPARRPAKGKR